jgi:hypothetical protein
MDDEEGERRECISACCISIYHEKLGFDRMASSCHGAINRYSLITNH